MDVQFTRRASGAVECAQGATDSGSRGVSVRLLLTVLAVLPLLGTGWFAARELNRTSDARGRAEFVSHRVADHVTLTRLRSHVLDERNWVLVELGVADIGVPLVMVESFAGIDPVEERDNAAENVDRLLASGEWPGIAADIEAVRDDPGATVAAGNEYLDIEQRLAAESDRILHELISRATDIQGGGDLVDSLRVLEVAAAARQATATQLTTYFAAQFSDPELAIGELELLAAQQALYDHALAALSRDVAGEGTASGSLDRVETSSDVAFFRQSIGELVGGALRNGTPETELSGAAAVFAEIDHIVAVFRAGTASSAQLLDLVDAAADDVATASADVSAATGAAANRAAWMFGLLAIVSLAFAFSVSRFIVTPLRRVAERARRLRDGEKLQNEEARGPREVRQVSGAIDEAAANLVLAERQARALAEGELDHPVLTESAPGHLGAALQNAVRTLASSLDEREEFRARLAHEAAHDGLTSLPNRNASLAQLQRGLARTRRNSAMLAVMFVDLDGFKDVNDSHGHQAGDQVLRAVAQRLVTGVRDGDHVGRLGGDEFLVVAEPVSGVDEALRLAERLQTAVSEPITSDGRSFRVYASVGVALTDSHSDLTADELLRDADLAVYKAKALGRGRIELCDEDLRAEVRRRAALEASLRDAISDGGFELAYQPAIDRRTGRIESVEALIRWDTTDMGTIPPPEFIEFAERSDLIIDIDRWVIERVTWQLAQWDDSSLHDLPVSINISGRHFASDRVVANILDPIVAAGIDPGRLVIELTESALLADLDGAAAKLTRLRDAGLKVAIDDFGTGYTSLAYLRTLPVDIIKIDRSFIIDEEAETLVKLIIDAGHLIGASITAEGVETESQATLLSTLGCDTFQGYYFARPCEPADLGAIKAAETLP